MIIVTDPWLSMNMVYGLEPVKKPHHYMVAFKIYPIPGGDASQTRTEEYFRMFDDSGAELEIEENLIEGKPSILTIKSNKLNRTYHYTKGSVFIDCKILGV